MSSWKKIKITYDGRGQNIYICHQICNICIAAQTLINCSYLECETCFDNEYGLPPEMWVIYNVNKDEISNIANELCISAFLLKTLSLIIFVPQAYDEIIKEG